MIFISQTMCKIHMRVRDIWMHVSRHMDNPDQHFKLFSTDNFFLITNIEFGGYREILEKYGVKVLFLISDYYQNKEEYEKCQEIKSAIDNHTSL